ncbi:ABC transporter ATP-binding protein [Paenibacillus tarimensis]|uniref:ABC transporter ATP-binding protein n=1 Tax=Paenibacillus tarimensis TaxID=416012 RepID=UPI001F3CBA78|nr:ABC transporter ATP-binding protein [Paenibacillus tarimensis]MCF2945232.1 ABC transporter ATP-binding protein [Paenibacillus tarimensis]
MEALTVHQLTKTFKSKEVVKQISFSLKTGEVFGFLGRNGAGKSTTINMLTGILPPTSGTIEILGTPYHQINSIKRRIGVLPDNSNYYNDMTAMQHMIFFSQVKGIPVRKDSLSELLEAVGLGEDMDRKAGQFSLGMKKKLGIAQALIGSPELVFLDEPTSTLDIESALQIRDLIGSLASKGTTVFMTSHNLDEVERICDRIAILHQGRIEKLGTIAELREAHNNRFKVKVKYRSGDKSRETIWLERIRQVADDVKRSEPFLELVVDSEEDIPWIVDNAVEQQVKIFGLEIEQPSLENIFLEQAQR